MGDFSPPADTQLRQEQGTQPGPPGSSETFRSLQAWPPGVAVRSTPTARVPVSVHAELGVPGLGSQPLLPPRRPQHLAVAGGQGGAPTPTPAAGAAVPCQCRRRRGWRGRSPAGTPAAAARRTEGKEAASASRPPPAPAGGAANLTHVPPARPAAWRPPGPSCCPTSLGTLPSPSQGPSSLARPLSTSLTP